MGSGFDVTIDEDPAGFLDRVGGLLAADPVQSTIVASVATRLAAAAAAGTPVPATPYSWFASIADEHGAVVGAAMRTAPFAPYPPCLLPMPDGAAVALADAVVDRGEEVGGSNGALPAARVFADRVAERTGGTVTPRMHLRLFELGTLRDAPPARGRLRPAYAEEAPLVMEWFHQFHVDADEQAGHDGRAHRPEGIDLVDIQGRIRNERVWMWVDDGDTPRHLTGFSPPAFGVARIGPVFTPKEHRGRGYASAAVAQVSRRLLDEGARVSLFTDQANPTSNRIYVALGYEPVVDTVDLTIG
ncbi:GNAT family N-acetyltransferase [Nocardioides stalactiti]|uniref:GNAT family N-acetyltransferase n=1 Tax=Nocardioides stalactiti TaxID=2755356 RepID=UPI0015FFFDB9|nr:GNAT family N-acetyltransferase [Nocardioides stalactiti]